MDGTLHPDPISFFEITTQGALRKDLQKYPLGEFFLSLPFIILKSAHLYQSKSSIPSISEDFLELEYGC